MKLLQYPVLQSASWSRHKVGHELVLWGQIGNKSHVYSWELEHKPSWSLGWVGKSVLPLSFSSTYTPNIHFMQGVDFAAESLKSMKLLYEHLFCPE